MPLFKENSIRSDAFSDTPKWVKNQPARKISKEKALRSASCIEVRFMKVTPGLKKRFQGNNYGAELYVEVIRKDLETGISLVQLIPLPFKGYPHSKERFDTQAISSLSPLREVENPCVTVFFHGGIEKCGKKVDLHIPMPALKGELQLRLNPLGNIELFHAPAGLDLKVETFGDFENTAKSKLRQCDITAKVVSNKNSLKVSEVLTVNAAQFSNSS
jgi:hypothetical protein